MEIPLIILANSLITGFAYKRRSLDRSGAVAAWLVGTGIFLLGDGFMWLILMSFFLSSSFLTRYTQRYKRSDDISLKENSGRNYIQVLANGGLGLLLALLYHVTAAEACYLAFAASFAAANSDTWASEIGVLSKNPPISIISGKPIARGLSGGVSPLGTVASLAGAAFIAAIFTLGHVSFYSTQQTGWLLFSLITAAGFFGSLVDSLLGATVQGKFYSSVHNRIVEKANYFGEKTHHITGLPFINNDLVNISSALFAALLVIYIWV